jgi:hypothetical protein
MAGSQDMIIIVVMMMMSSVFAVLVGGAYFMTKPEEGDECEGKDENGNYVIDEDGDCVLDYCDSGYTQSGGGCVVVVPDGDQDESGGGGGGGQKEVFHLSGYETAKGDAAGVCSALGAELATRAQVAAAQAANADWCSTGWVSDQDSALYPITYEVQGGCGNGSAGVKEYTPPNNLAGVNCYGVKPAKDGANDRIRAFNAKRWSRYDTPTKPNEVYYLGGPTGGYEIVKSNAENECTNFGAVVATKAQVEAAQKNQADWCATGWVSDQDTAVYPITTNTQGGCGNGSAGIKEWTPPSNLAGVNCYGPKPGPDDPGAVRIKKFNDSKWSKYD